LPILVFTEEELIEFLKKRGDGNELLLILGGGSNILFTEDFQGTILYPAIEGIQIEKENAESVVISVGAGVNWDSLVEWCVGSGFGGFENLSLIPGNAGATPIQNIGAYGVEIKDRIEKVRTVSILDGTIREFSNYECRFGYRDSIFKNELKGKYVVTRVFYNLTKNPLLNLGYGALKTETEKLGPLSLENVRQGVINIRRSKLPDPEITGNAGSFFKNPVVNNLIAEKLKKEYPTIPSYTDSSDYTKLAAGWLIEQCGWKGQKSGKAAVHEKQALVLINTGNATGKEIFELSEKIRQSVYETFGVELKREVEVIGTI
jgi:UDP-N-acetylmuramate dehydrogenase